MQINLKRLILLLVDFIIKLLIVALLSWPLSSLIRLFSDTYFNRSEIVPICAIVLAILVSRIDLTEIFENIDVQ